MATTDIEFIGPAEILTSEQAIDRIVAAGKSRENARQTLSRRTAAGDLWRSSKFSLPGGGRLYARANFWGSGEFFSKLAALVAQTDRPGIARCLEALSRNDVLTKSQAIKLLAAPVTGRTQARNLSYEEEVEAMGELGVVLNHKDGTLEHLIRKNFVNPDASDEALRRELSKDRRAIGISRVLIDHFRRQAMISWRRFFMPTMERGFAEFSNQAFSAVGYSYLDPVIRFQETKIKPCPVLFDVYADRCTKTDVESFLARIQRSRYSTKSRLKIWGVIAAKAFTVDAFELARKERLMPIDLRQTFGEQALKAMALVEDLIGGFADEPTAYTSNNDLVDITKLLKELRANPIVEAIRSIAFEALACCVIQVQGYYGAGMNKIVPYDTTTRDIDAYGNRGDEYRIIECKAENKFSVLRRGDVVKFFGETVNAYIAHLRKEGREVKSLVAEIWTTGQVDDDARNALAELRMPSIVKARILDRHQVREELPSAVRERGWLLLHEISEYPDPRVDDDPTSGGLVIAPSLNGNRRRRQRSGGLVAVTRALPAHEPGINRYL